MSIAIGKTIESRYVVTARIGHGGMAEVYEANDIISRKRVAIKLIKEDVMLNPVNMKRFENEAMIAAGLDHPNIVKVYYNGVVDGVPYIVHEYVKGQTLKEVLDFRSTLPIAEAVSYMLQLTNAMYYAHSHGVIHRDIKPDNIFIMPDGTVKLADFGIALATGVSEATISSKEIIGSVHYLAPEIAGGKVASSKSDIYAAGVTFFEMITGHVPFDNSNAVNIAVSHIRDRFPSPKKYLPNCPKEVEKVIFTAVKKNPTDRYVDAKAFHDALENLTKSPDLLKEKKSLLSKIFGFK